MADQELLAFRDHQVNLVHIKAGATPSEQDKATFSAGLALVRNARSTQVKLEAANALPALFPHFPTLADEAFDVYIDLLEDADAVRRKALVGLPQLSHGGRAWKIGDLLTQLLGDAEGDEKAEVSAALVEVLKGKDGQEALRGITECIVGRPKPRLIGLGFLSTTAPQLTKAMKDYLAATVRGVLVAQVEDKEWDAYVGLLGKLGGEGLAQVYADEAARRSATVDPASEQSVSSLISLLKNTVPLARAGASPAPFLAPLLTLLTPESYAKLAPKHQLGVARMAADLGPSADLAPLFVHLASASTIDLSRLEPVLYLLASHKPRPSSEEVKEAAKKAYVAAQESAAQARMEKEAIDGKLAAAEPEARKTLEESKKKWERAQLTADAVFALSKSLLSPLGGNPAVRLSWRPAPPPAPVVESPKGEKRKAEGDAGGDKKKGPVPHGKQGKQQQGQQGPKGQPQGQGQKQKPKPGQTQGQGQGQGMKQGGQQKQGQQGAKPGQGGQQNPGQQKQQGGGQQKQGQPKQGGNPLKPKPGGGIQKQGGGGPPKKPGQGQQGQQGQNAPKPKPKPQGGGGGGGQPQQRQGGGQGGSQKKKQGFKGGNKNNR